MSKHPVNKTRALDIVTQLMAVPGKSCEESQIAETIRSLLLANGIDESRISFDTAHKKTPQPGEVGNMFVKLPGPKKLPRVLLSAHIDTVPICVGAQPKRKKDRIESADPSTGLGADDRAGVAAILIGLIEAMESGAELKPVTLCFFVQEEIGLQGSRNMTISKLGKPEMAFNFDGGNPYKLTIGATGGERMKIELQGVPAHAGLEPQNGANAITAASLAIASLEKNKWLGSVKKRSSRGTSNIGVIRGGNATNVVTDYVEIQAEARSQDGEFRDLIASTIEQAFIEAAAKVTTANGTPVTATVHRRVDYEAFSLSRDSECVQIATQAIEDLGRKPEYAISNGGVDANWLVKHGVPAVTIGCGQRNVHTTDEWLHIDDFLAACYFAKTVITQDAS